MWGSNTKKTVNVTPRFKPLVQDLNKLRHNGRLCDVTVVAANGDEVPAHANILASSCQALKCQLEAWWREKRSGQTRGKHRITLDFVRNGEAVNHLLDYLYTAQTRLTSDTVGNVYETAGVLDLAPLTRICLEFVRGDLKPDNVFRYLEFGEDHDAVDIIQSCRAYIALHLSEVALLPHWSKLSPQQLRDILRDRRLVLRDSSMRTGEASSKGEACGGLLLGLHYEHALLCLLERWSQGDVSRADHAVKMVQLIKKTLSEHDVSADREKKTYSEPSKTAYIPVSPLPFAASSFNRRDVVLSETVSTSTAYPPNEWYMKAFTAYITPELRNERVVAGFDITYRHLWRDIEGVHSFGYGDAERHDIETVQLREGENIVRVVLGGYQHVTVMTMWTNQGRRLGPFGEHEHRRTVDVKMSELCPRAGELLYLSGFKYQIVRSAEGPVLTNKLQMEFAMFDWETYLEDFYAVLSNDELFLQMAAEREPKPETETDGLRALLGLPSNRLINVNHIIDLLDDFHVRWNEDHADDHDNNWV